MPAVHATLTWATPVDIKILGAHLEAFVNTLATVNTLRLCHRFGHGPQAMISQLPPELLTSVEEHIISDERQRLLEDWTTDCKCFEQRCHPTDHMDETQLEQVKAKVKGLPSPFEGDEDVTEEDSLEYYLWTELMDEWDQIHYSRISEWEGRVGMKSAARRGFFSDNQNMIKRHFGLDVWISHVRHEEHISDNGWSDINLWPAETTIAYLKVLESKDFFERCEMTNSELEDPRYLYIESGYGMGMTMPDPLSNSSRAKFKRMMNILDVKPCALQTKIHNFDRLTVDQTKADVETDEQSWPQLTLLIKTTARGDEDSR